MIREGPALHHVFLGLKIFTIIEAESRWGGHQNWDVKRTEMMVVKMCEVSVTSLHRVVITDNSKVLYTFKLLRTYFKCLHQEK